ncbi:MAG: CvpA family protein [Deltaproteobacteria bacterium]|nr:CvpA family protein [Deltaproteobacteria bacterium]
MNLDILVVGLVLFFAVLGALAGGLMQLSHWAGLILGGFLAKPLGVHLGPLAAQRFGAPDIIGVLGVTVVAFFAIYLIAQIILRAVIKRVTQNRVLGSADRLLGFGLGGGKAGVFLYVLVSAMIFFEKPFTAVTHYQFDTRGSKIADFIRAHNLFTTFSFPGTRGLTAIARAAKDPAAAAELGNDPEIQALTKDPRVQQLLQDGELQRAIQSGDSMGMLRNNRVMAVLSDSKLQDALVHAGEHMPDSLEQVSRGKRR